MTNALIGANVRITMLNQDSFQYAMENTQVIVAPERRIESFASTSFRFYLVTELMDSVNQVRVRDGRLHADRPQIVAPSHLSQVSLEGFGEKAREFADWMQENRERFALLKYGFQFRKTDVVESLVHDPVEQVLDRIRAKVDAADEPLSAVIQGVDDAWEVCLLKFTMDLIQQSAGGNFGDFRRGGLL
jgi:hypothetical protein